MATKKNQPTPERTAATIAASVERCRLDVAAAWRVWEPVLQRERSHDVDGLAAIVAVATAASSTPRELSTAQTAWTALPQHASPPPWAGHFYGAVVSLLRARLAGDDVVRGKEARSCRAFCRVAPDGTKLPAVR